MRERKNPIERKEQLLREAILLSKKIGYRQITREAVAIQSRVSFSLISAYFGTIENLKYSVLETAINERIIEIIAQGLSLNDPQTAALSRDLKMEVARYMSK